MLALVFSINKYDFDELLLGLVITQTKFSVALFKMTS